MLFKSGRIGDFLSNPESAQALIELTWTPPIPWEYQKVILFSLNLDQFLNAGHARCRRSKRPNPGGCLILESLGFDKIFLHEAAIALKDELRISPLFFA
ncbi:MAG: hypothetical protein ACKO4M_07140 [Betaproteobacteria bacterium]